MSDPIREESALVVASSGDVQLGTLHASTPGALVAGASLMATTLADVIERQKLYSMIQGRKHVRVEGWTTLAVMLGCTAREVANEAQADGSFVAVVELVRMGDGVVIARASSECGSDDDGGRTRDGKWWSWAERPRYARRSMAATRATGKACRLAFSWIMALAGFEATPAEEMPADDAPREVPAKRASRARENIAEVFDVPASKARPRAGEGLEWLDDEIGFGRHKARTWRYMAEQHPDYLQWMLDRARDENKSGPNTDKAASALDWVIGQSAPQRASGEEPPLDADLF